MATQRVPVTGKDSNYPQVITLDGVDFTARLLWNARSGRWFMTIRDNDGVDLITARKMCSDIPWSPHETIEGIPAGQLWVIDLTALLGDPGLRDLGQRVTLMYVEEANVI